MLSRRSFLTGLIAAPVIVRATSIMPVRKVVWTGIDLASGPDITAIEVRTIDAIIGYVVGDPKLNRHGQLIAQIALSDAEVMNMIVSELCRSAASWLSISRQDTSGELEMIIVGAGMAGLLAARMLSHRKPVVWETQKALPNNHSAVLRFRTSQVGDILGIPFKKVNMIKDTLHWRNPIADSLAYSYKNSGSYRSDRSVTRGLVSEERFIAPPDLISQMAEGVKIEFGREYDPNDPHVRGSNVISTIPMPALMELLDYDMGPDFNYREGGRSPR
jgi:hypothetical protein